MKLAPILQLAAAIAIVHCAPVTDIPPGPTSDADVLNYALFLENLEVAFFSEGLSNYTQQDFAAAGVNSSGFTDNLQRLRNDEKTHADFLTGSLRAAGQKASAPCNYSFPVDDAASFLALARMIEGIGTSAYIGAARFLSNKTHLTAAGGILAVEARHESYLNAVTGSVPYPNPFDTPLLFGEVYSLAAPFVESCPSTNPKLPVKAFPTISVTPGDNETKIVEGGRVIVYPADTFNASSVKDLRGGFVTANETKWTPLMNYPGGKYQIVVPTGLFGMNYFVLNKGDRAVNDDTVAAGPAVVTVMNATTPVTPVDNATLYLQGSQ